ncbi:MAG TPA: hypothetical protein DCZ91_18390 [Lachnospiraceae bacterium]|nr:hypothetical protein [Lachnospiraceae bacterium]
MGRKKIALVLTAILAVAVLLTFICVSWWFRHSAENGKASDSGQTASGNSDSAPKEILKAVLFGDAPFQYCSDGKTASADITDVPALFDADDPFMKIWEFSVADLDGDGEEEVILSVAGAAGDMGGKVILHRIDDAVYGYSTDNRTLVDLKTDGTYGYSDPTGLAETGIAVVTGFSSTGYTVEKLACAAGTYEGWDSFALDRQPAGEGDFMDMLSQQETKPNAEWHDFTDENIDAIF